MSSRKQQKAANRREHLAAERAARRRRTRNLRLSVAMVAAVVLAVGTVIGVNALGGSEPSTAESRLVRADSHRLQTAENAKVTLVEFLDFECPACGSMYPVVKRLQQDYEGEVTFVVRYFPLDMHVNGERAAHAVEAAAQQGEFEAMYDRMFETQSQWAGQQQPRDEVFRGYAADLGLDMDKYDADYKAEATAERVRQDVEDGKELGVQGTPTFFLNGEQIEPRTYQDFKAQIDAALDK